MTGDADFEDIITVVEGVPDPKTGSTRKLCAIRIYKKADSTPRPVIEIPEKEQQYFPYDILKVFDNVKDAHDYAEEKGIIHVEY
ncbi:MAG: hypothetical protein ACW98Y_17120 [Candidatus Thorarchaeota archaeon]|jgi:hypothetical protein